jgi:hypothetical protein
MTKAICYGYTVVARSNNEVFLKKTLILQNMKEEFDLILEPGRSEKNYFADLWRYRELFYILS